MEEKEKNKPKKTVKKPMDKVKETVKKIIQKKLWNPYPKYKICKKKPRHIDYLGDIYLKAEDKYIIIEIKNVICAT